MMQKLPGPVLAFDTSAAHCAAAFIGADARVTAARVEAMAKGQAERLLPLLHEVLAEAGAGWGDLAGLAVGIGPGNFTGVRISVAAARGLALARRCPAVGLSNFELFLDPIAPEAEGDLLITLAAPRGQLYLQRFAAGEAQGKPALLDPAELPAVGPAILQELPAGLRLRGEGAEALAERLGLAFDPLPEADFLTRLAGRAAWAFGRPLPDHRPAPLYVRPADAAPPSDPAPVILDA